MKKRLIVMFFCVLLFLSGCSNSTSETVLKSGVEKEAAKADNVQVLPTLENNQSKSEEHKESSDKQVKNSLVKEISNLVQIKDLDSSIVIDLKYATEENFTHKKISPVPICLIRKETGAKLVKVSEELKKFGYFLKVWDAYRPPYVQKILWETTSDKRFVANPYKGGSKHNRGSAVDVTLVDSNGREVEMPTGFDDFSSKAFRSNKNITPKVKANLELLTNTMKKYGFTTIDSEWWHYDDSDYKNYPIVDIKLDEFLK